jgi:hypothetical protein
MRTNDRAWIATRKGLFELRRAASGWRIERTSFLGEPVSMLLPPGGDNRMLAALNLGHFGVKLHASADAGATWTEVTTPIYPAQPADATGPAWKLQQIWSLEAAHGTVWAGTLPGGLFRSSDFGRSWTLVESLWRRPERVEWMGGGYDVPGIHSIVLEERNPGRIMIGISTGGAWTSDDDGATWRLSARGMRAAFMPPELADNENAQDAHRIVACAADPRVLWCQHHCGLWRSTDGGAHWNELTTHAVSNFGFAAAAHAGDPLTAWFVPAVKDERRIPVDGALAVTRTRDGGRTFEILREGLPQRDCYDLVYRHGMDVTDDGRSLVIGSTTGNAWTSADAGDSWTTLPAHLPPIAAVRFG